MAETIWTEASSVGSSGCADAVWKRSVSGSTTSTRWMARTKPPKPPGLFGTFGARSMVKATSSAVKSRPSCHFTPARSLNSHTVSDRARQLSASAGWMRARASCSTRRSKMCIGQADVRRGIVEMRVERGGRAADADGQVLRRGRQRQPGQGQGGKPGQGRPPGREMDHRSSPVSEAAMRQPSFALRSLLQSHDRENSGSGGKTMRNGIRMARGMTLGAAVSTLAGLAAGDGALAQAPTPGTGPTLTMAVGSPVTSLDPHFHQLSPNNAVADMIFDKLVETDDKARNQPGLATEWRAIAPTVWEFKLREGVRFHNGSAFTAEDVAFTLQRLPNVPNAPSSFAIYSRPLTRIEVVDPLTIRLHTASPYPLLPLDMTNVRIIDAETHANATTEGFNSGALAVGTGPFRVLTHRSGDRIEFERNATYWGPAPAFQRVNYRMITNDATRTASLLSGDIDFMDQVPTTTSPGCAATSGCHLSETVGLRLIFLGLDHLREAGENSPFVTDNDGRPLGRNPLRDVRVRRALSMAIDRGSITERIMDGAATPAGPVPAARHLQPRPRRPADALRPGGRTAAAGRGRLPQRLPHPAQHAERPLHQRCPHRQAVGAMWTRIGVRTTVEAQTWSIFVNRAGRAEYSSHLIGWGSNPDGSHPMRNIIASVSRERGWGASNRGRYSNPQLDALLEQAMVELDEPKRERMLIDIQRMAAEDVAIIPLHIQTNIWAMRRNLTHLPRVDELTRAQDVRPATMR
jgi:peptide/nickel transport system substrate-binding protein